MQIAALTGDTDVNLNRKALIVMCADNGVVEEGVTQTGQEVTAVVAENFTKARQVYVRWLKSREWICLPSAFCLPPPPFDPEADLFKIFVQPLCHFF